MEYLLIAQDQPLVSCYRRQVDGAWALTVYQTGDQVMLTSLDLEFPINALYQGLD
jgi:Uma2 family endonuclease